jgi:hypothetical protein
MCANLFIRKDMTAQSKTIHAGESDGIPPEKQQKTLKPA